MFRRGALGLITLMLLASCNRANTLESLRTSSSGPTLTARIDVGGPIVDLLFAEGDLWVNRGRDIVRIDPDKNRVVDHFDPLEGPTHSSLTSGAGSIWSSVSDFECVRKGISPFPDCVQKLGEVHRIDPRSGQVQARIDFGDRTPGGIAVVDQAVWVVVGAIEPDLGGGELRQFKEGEDEEPVDEGEPGYLVRIDPLTNQIAGSTPLPEPDRSFMVLSAGEGGLWLYGERLYHLDPSTGKVIGEIYTTLAPDRFAIGDGFIWLKSVSDSDEPQVVKIDPKTNSVVSESLTEFYGDMQWGEGFLWLVDDRPLTRREEAGWAADLRRFDPETSRVNGQAEAGFTASDNTHAESHVETGAGSIWVATYGYVARFDPKQTSSPQRFDECPARKLNPKYVPAGFKEEPHPRETPVLEPPENPEELLPVRTDWTRMWKSKDGDAIRFRGGVVGTEVVNLGESLKDEPIVIRNYEGQYRATSPTGESVLKWSEETDCGVKDFEISATGVPKERLIRMTRSLS